MALLNKLQLIQTITNYLDETIGERAFEWPAAQFTTWVANVGDHLTRYPEVRAELADYLETLHQWAFDHLDLADAVSEDSGDPCLRGVSRIIFATEYWAARVYDVDVPVRVVRADEEEIDQILRDHGIDPS